LAFAEKKNPQDKAAVVFGQIGGGCFESMKRKEKEWQTWTSSQEAAELQPHHRTQCESDFGFECLSHA
jgi:hypothetical protein